MAALPYWHQERKRQDPEAPGQEGVESAHPAGELMLRCLNPGNLPVLQAWPGRSNAQQMPPAVPGHPQHTHLLVLIGCHSYELGLWEGAVRHHSMGTPDAHDVDLGLVLVQRIQHDLLGQKRQRKRRRASSEEPAP